MWEKYGILEEMKCYINHKFTTIAWGLVFIIILFCGCSNMIERLRAISDAELSVVLLCDNTNVANIEIPLGEAKSFSFIVRDKNTGEIIDNFYFLKDIQWGYPKDPTENSDAIEVSFSENKQTMTVKGIKATKSPGEIYVTVNGVKSNVCAVTVKDEPIEPEKEIKVILTSNDQQADNLELQVEEERKFSFKIQDAQTGEIISDLTIIKDIQWSYSESDYISYTLDSNGIILTIRGVKATETPNEIYVTVNGVKSNVCAVTVKDPWEDIEVVIEYYEGFVKNFELALGKSTTLSVVLWDKNAKELIDDISLYKNIQWQYPTSSKYISATVNPNKASLFLTGNNPTETPEEISVSVNGISSDPCMITVGKYYSVETPEDLKDVINKVETSGVTEIHISGNKLVSSANSLIQIAQSLPERDGNKYTLDLSEVDVGNIDLSTDFINYPTDIGYYNSSVEEIILPEGLTTIGENALWGFTALERINIPSTVETIGSGALSGTKIRELVIPGSVRSIGNGAFDGCNELSSLIFVDSSTELSLMGYNFINCKIAELAIPARIKIIGENTFSRCSSLKKITFEPRTDTINIAADAFDLCTSLSEVIIDKEDVSLITGEGAKNILSHVPQP